MVIFEERRGAEIHDIVDQLGQLRIEIFREYPYLYDGNLAYEKEYIGNYATSPTSYVAVAKDCGVIVGAITCLAMAEAEPVWRQAFEDHGLPVEEYCYFGEVVLNRAYRGCGDGRILINMAQRYAREIGKNRISLCTVDRMPDHPQRPADYVPVDLLLLRRGYVKHPQIKSKASWPQVDSCGQSVENTLSFWIK